MTAGVVGGSRPYYMTLSLSVLDHLGLNLYSNIPAVLSEVVANAWDASAEVVDITLDLANQSVVITDDGDGMTAEDVNKRFLYVGYRRRDDLSPVNRLGRHVMGRKGIGKLSLFAIADEIQVETAKDGEQHGFVLRTDDIRAAIRDEEIYYPEPIDTDVSVTRGTRVALAGLKVRMNAGTERFLRRRLARRFSVIGPMSQFGVLINGEPIAVADRGYFHAVEYLWTLGDNAHVEALCVNKKRSHALSAEVDPGNGWTVTGWIGTVDEQKSLGGEANVLPILTWGKVAHENILPELDQSGVFAKYIIGEVSADFVDADDQEDIATSNRQSIKETDPRFHALRDYLVEAVRTIGSQWRNWRNEDAADKARENPVVKEWFESLHGDALKAAKQLFGKIGRLPLSETQDRTELYKHGILAFEKLRLRDLLSELARIEAAADLELIGRVFASIDEIEAAQYGEIVRGRLSVIEKFTNLVDDDERERVIQAYLFDHLWLLDPSWERASTNRRIEEKVTTEFADVDARLSSEEKAGRIDIRYRTAAGKHIIIELKKYGRRVKTGELLDQMGKYRTALEKVLQRHFPDEPRNIECIAILGYRPDDLDPERVDDALASINARVITYDALIQDSLESYAEYLAVHEDLSRVADIISRLEAQEAGNDQGQISAEAGRNN
jgi:hypothetical protein